MTLDPARAKIVRAAAFAALIQAFVVSDFSVALAANHSFSAQPLLFKITSVWGNHEGSMLLWVLILVLFGALVALFGRNLPGEPGSSMISPHLHWGELSPSQVWHCVLHAAHEARQDAGQAIETYLGELIWREFSAYLLWHRPALPEQPLREAFARLPFRDAPGELRRWQRGQTGIPIVDAGMRQLWHIGWMHNRVRMIAASFLVKQLLVAWQDGEIWFWDTLVDADLANNAVSWQWIAGTGIDSQPFFRVFNPVTQGERWDPDGAYVRRWVPELAKLPAQWVHKPWAAPADILRKAGVRIGDTYPAPMVDLADARGRALSAYRATVKAANAG